MASLGSDNNQAEASTAESDGDGDSTVLCEKFLPDWLCYSVIAPGVCLIGENLLLVATIWRGSGRSLSASSYAFLASLALADALVGAACLVLVVTYLRVYPESGRLYPASVLFSVDIIAAQTLMLISVLHMAVLALDRYLYILKPFVYARRVTRKVIMATIAVTWLLGILTMSLPALYYIRHQWTPFCEAFDTNPVFTISMSSAYLVVFALTCFAYIQIFREVKRHERAIAVLRVPFPHASGRATHSANKDLQMNASIEGEAKPTTPASQSQMRFNQDQLEPQTSPVADGFRKQEQWKATIKIVKFLLLVLEHS